MNQKTIIIGAAVLLTFVLGYVLGRSGRPYSSLILTIHKLVSLAATAVWITAIVQLRRDIGLSPGQIAVAVAAGMLFLITVATGGILSAMEQPPKTVSVIHSAAPWGVLGAGTFSLLHPLLAA